MGGTMRMGQDRSRSPGMPPRRPLLAWHGLLAHAAREWEKIVPEPEGESQGGSVGTSVLPPPTPHEPGPRWKRYCMWADLLPRVFAIVVFCCPHCGGPRRLALITEFMVIDRILDHLGIGAWPQRPPLPGRAGWEAEKGWEAAKIG